MSYYLKKAEPFLPKDYKIASDQLHFKGTWVNDTTVNGEDKIDEIITEEVISFKSDKTEVSFDKKTGFVNSYSYNNQAIIKTGHQLRPNFWRAPNDNDMGASLQKKLLLWKEAVDNLALVDWTYSITEDNIIKVKARYNLSAVHSELELKYEINSDGELNVEQALSMDENKEVPMLPRFGMEVILPKIFNSISYYGRGPHENYIDRNYSSQVGLYHQSVKEQYFAYIRPQETGHKTGIRWYDISNGQIQLHIESQDLLGITALHYLKDDLDDGLEKDQRNAGDISERNLTSLQIDFKQMGLGSIDSWGALPMKKYRLLNKEYVYQFKITPSLR